MLRAAGPGLGAGDLVLAPISRVLSVAAARRSMEAEDRLGFITDVSMLFAGKGERGHIARLAREAEGGSSKRSAKAGLRMDDQSGEAKESGAYVPGKSYEEA